MFRIPLNAHHIRKQSQVFSMPISRVLSNFVGAAGGIKFAHTRGVDIYQWRAVLVFVLARDAHRKRDGEEMQVSSLHYCYFKHCWRLWRVWWYWHSSTNSGCRALKSREFSIDKIISITCPAKLCSFCASRYYLHIYVVSDETLRKFPYVKI